MPSRNNKRRRQIQEASSHANRSFQRQSRDVTFQRMQPPVPSNQSATSHFINDTRQNTKNETVTQDTQPQIPGYFYDPDKKRYFKIQKGHEASSGAYCMSTISTMKAATERKSEAIKRRSRGKVRFQRCKLFGSAISSTIHCREAGLRSKQKLKFHANLFLLSQLHGAQFSNDPTDVLADRSWCPLSALHGISRRSRNQRHPQILFNVNRLTNGGRFMYAPQLDFRYDKDQKALFFVVPEGTTYQPWVCAFDRNKPFAQHNPLRPLLSPAFTVPVLANQLFKRNTNVGTAITPRIIKSRSGTSAEYIITSLERGLLDAAFRFEVQENQKPASQLLYDDHDQHLFTIVGVGHRGMRWLPPEAYGDTHSRDHWCATVRPPPKNKIRDDGRVDVFEAYDRSLHVIPTSDSTGDMWSHQVARFFVADFHSDCLALEFIDHNTLLAGLRDASVICIKFVGNKVVGSRCIIKHPGSVVNLLALKQRPLLIVNGIADCLCLYDLSRCANQDSPMTTPMIRYDYHNLKNPGLDLGFDVCENLDLLAASQDDGSIKIFCISTGDTLQILAIPSLANGRAQPWRPIQIIEEDDGVCRVLAGRGGVVMDFAARYD